MAPDYTPLPERAQKLLADGADESGAMAAILAEIADLDVAPLAPDSDGDTEDIGGLTVTHRFVEAPGDVETMRWHYVEAGTGDPLVLLHGIPQSWHMWSPILPELAKHFRCIAIDLKGYGQSHTGRGDYRHEGVAQQVIALLDTLEIENFWELHRKVDARSRRVHDDGMGWDKINKAAAVLGIATFLGSAGTWTWELFTSPDRNVMGSVVSLHALYFGAAVGSTVLALACSWSVVSWAIGLYKGWKDKRIRNSPSSQFQFLHDDVVREFKATKQDEEDVINVGRSKASSYTERESLRFALSKCGVRTPDPSKASDDMWYQFLTNLVPLSLHGRVEDARILGARFDKQKGSS